MKRDFSYRNYFIVAGVIILLGVSRLISLTSLLTQKEPYRLEDADFSQVKKGDRVTLDVEYCYGIGAYNFLGEQNTKTGEFNWMAALDRDYLVPLVSYEGDEPKVDHVISVKVSSDHYHLFTGAKERFYDLMNWPYEETNINKIPKSLVYHYTGMIEEMSDDLYEASATELRKKGLEDRLVRYRLVPLPKEFSVEECIISGCVFVFLGLLIGILVWVKDKRMEA